MDAKNLFERLIRRKKESIIEFSLKRTREHFGALFFTRYPDANLNDLKLLSPELLTAIDQFYNKVDELKWYLDHTQDMTNTVEDSYDIYLKGIKKSYQTMELYLNAEL